ncbi:folate-binding protein YgfZ [Kangiella sp. TOML190]|uniref:CAF17-like 4Fe-4S cluster assembly/insertion protein YgfZ n=1 Tax=Kangiella sp. TOML190 TaxID=2931351 RepID=UPI00203C20F7|nr:folate-binding protein YgfZ [Kangiella sp. TOML190]
MNNTTAYYQTIEDYGLLRIAGTDAKKFLQGQITADMELVTEQQAQLGGYCNVQGRLHAIFYVLKIQDDYWLLMPQNVIEHCQATLSKYAVFFQVNIDQDQSLALVASQQPATNRQHLSVDPDSKTLTIGKLNLHLLEPADKQELLNQLKDSTEIAEQQQHLLNFAQIQLAIPMVFAETIEKLLPHSIGLPQAGGVNFEKGCYTGQEIVARMHYRGNLKTHAHKLKLNSSLIAPVTEVNNQADKKLGELIYSAQVGSQIIALASLSDKALEQDLYIDNTAVTLTT